MAFIFSKHALDQMSERGLSEEIVLGVITNPGEIIHFENMKIYQSVRYNDEGEPYLIRAFVNFEKEPGLVVTAYKTSKIKKYYEGKI
ncbi:MAG: DUF4258 domain-containing protein [Bacteroidales bacterium]|nr:DUF4258 domain-containing protein [Bacteroidales bacterium]